MTRLRPLLGRDRSRALAIAVSVAASALLRRAARRRAPRRTVIQNKGSDTMVNVAQAWAEEYQKVAPDVEVEVSGGGSGVGIAALDQGARSTSPTPAAT